MSPLHRSLRALFLPATSTRRTTAQAISAFHTDARKPSLLRESVPGARQEAPQSSALRLCRPPLRYAPSTPLIAPFQGWGTPPLALAAPAGVGQGQGVFVSKHSTAIHKRRNHPMTYTATYSPEDNKLRLYSSSRLDAETYARVRGAGFIYAPKQELFVAPMWTHGRPISWSATANQEH